MLWVVEHFLSVLQLNLRYDKIEEERNLSRKEYSERLNSMVASQMLELKRETIHSS